MGKFRDERYGKTLEAKKAKMVALAVDSVKRARNCVDDVQFYAEDAGRADAAYLFEMLEAVIDAGATVVNIPDTTGYTVPEQYGELIRQIRENVPNIANARPSACTATTILASRSPTLWLAFATVRARWKGRSTESANEPATPRWKKS